MPCKGDRPPAYPNRSEMAAELCMSQSTVDEMVRRGVLPEPLHLSSGCVRWEWTAVVTALASLKTGTSVSDLYSARARDAAKIATEGRRGAA